MVKEGKSLIMPIPWHETLEPSTSVTEGKGLGEDKERDQRFLTSNMMNGSWIKNPKTRRRRSS